MTTHTTQESASKSTVRCGKAKFRQDALAEKITMHANANTNLRGDLDESGSSILPLLVSVMMQGRERGFCDVADHCEPSIGALVNSCKHLLFIRSTKRYKKPPTGCQNIDK